MDMKQFKAPAERTSEKALRLKVRTPRSAEDVRARPDSIAEGVGIVKLGNRYFLVGLEQSTLLSGHVINADLVLAQASSGEFFIWPVRSDRQGAHDAADKAKLAWQKVEWVMSRKAYEATRSTTKHPDPDWPPESDSDLVTTAFPRRIIDRPDHPAIQEIKQKAES